jgi:hypothetical protein
MITYGGVAIFGYASRLVPQTNESASQKNEFFGVKGVQSLYGGGRGRTFVVRFVLVDNHGDLASQIATIENYDDGIGRTLAETVLGRSWDHVIFKQAKQVSERILAGPVVEYEAYLEGEI